jgi:hypothetical protein
MPKEFVFDPADREHQPFTMAVGWQRDQYVQVGIQINGDLAGDGTQADLLSVLYASDEEQIENIGRLMVYWMTTEGVKRDWDTIGESSDLCTGLGRDVLSWVRAGRPPVERDGIWVTLSRGAANAAIRHLKKASRAAFGRDEW